METSDQRGVMDQPATPSAQVPDLYKLTERLQEAAKQLEGIRADHFVDQRSLCTACKYAVIMRQASQNARKIHCSIFSKWMPEDITQCSAYQSINTLSLSQMADIAVLINDRADRHQGYL
jgi:hypothetical protein